MNDYDQKITDLATNLMQQGIARSRLDSMRMAQSMIQGTDAMTQRNSATVSASEIKTGRDTIAPNERLEQENKYLSEQMQIAKGRISELERREQELLQRIETLSQPESVVEPVTETVVEEVIAPQEEAIAIIEESPEQPQQVESRPKQEEIQESEPQFITSESQNKSSYDFEF